jgi:hypothetical protein
LSSEKRKGIKIPRAVTEPVEVSLISQGTKPLSFTLTDYSYKVRNWLYWYDESGRRLLTLEEEVEQAGQRAEQEKQRADRLTQKLRELGLNPEDL